jgi:hypothetical protein
VKVGAVNVGAVHVVTGIGVVVLGEGGTDVTGDPLPYLTERKNRKYLGVQDDVAVVSAARALLDAGLLDAHLPGAGLLSGPGTSDRAWGERAGLYLAVGYIPFRMEDVERVLAASVESVPAPAVPGRSSSMERFSMELFSTVGYTRAHPFVTFRCLPNMPAYHVLASFGIRGPYLVTYPGAAQWYDAFEEACAALADHRIDVALVGGVCCQRNFLVEHHFRRLDPPVPPDHLRDAGAFVVLEREQDADARGAPERARLSTLRRAYRPFDPRRGLPPHEEWFEADGADATLPFLAGPASIGIALDRTLRQGRAALSHRIASRDGGEAMSTWSLR